MRFLLEYVFSDSFPFFFLSLLKVFGHEPEFTPCRSGFLSILQIKTEIEYYLVTYLSVKMCFMFCEL